MDVIPIVSSGDTIVEEAFDVRFSVAWATPLISVSAAVAVSKGFKLIIIKKKRESREKVPGFEISLLIKKAYINTAKTTINKTTIAAIEIPKT